MCVPCKIIIDSPGALAASARFLARILEAGKHDARMIAAAHYLADIATASGNALVHAISIGYIRHDDGTDRLDEAHAFSELNCHRATYLRANATGSFSANVTWDRLMGWAEETRLHTTKLIGGEYQGGFIVDGVNGIARKE